MKMPSLPKKDKKPLEVDKKKLEEEKAERKYVKKKAPKYERMTIDELVPIVKKHDSLDCYIMEDGTFVSIYGILEKNLQGAPEMEINYDNNCWDKLYKTYSDDLKIVTSNFPTDTRRQVSYYDYLLEKADSMANASSMFKSLLEQKRAELIWIAENRHEENASLFAYSKTMEDFKEKDRRIMSVLNGLVYKYDDAMERKILYMLYNKTEAL